MKDDDGGEVVGTTIYAVEINQEELRAHLASQLAAFKVPEYIFVSDTPLERNAAGKLLTKNIKKKATHARNKNTI